jgi:hypothetical protein
MSYCYTDFLKEHSLPDNSLSWRCYQDSGKGRQNWIDLFWEPGDDLMEIAKSYDEQQDKIKSERFYLTDGIDDDEGDDDNQPYVPHFPEVDAIVKAIVTAPKPKEKFPFTAEQCAKAADEILAAQKKEARP